MDHFGIRQGVVAAARIYFQSGRRTGRTVSLVESLNTGDRVVFSCSKEAERVTQLCKERDVAIEAMVVHPKEAKKLFERGTPQGRTIFDHSWVEQYYIATIDRCREEIDFFQRELSGYGAAHRETRRTAEEMAKWSPFL